MLWASEESGQGTMGGQSSDFPRSGRVSLGPTPSSPGAGGQLSYAMRQSTETLQNYARSSSLGPSTSTHPTEGQERAKSSSEMLQVLGRGSSLVRREHKTHALVLDPGKVGLSPSGAAAKVTTSSQRNIAGFSRGICRVR